MTSVFDDGLSGLPSGGRGGTDTPAAAPRPHAVWPWIVRLVLPVLLYLAGQVLYWLWFDNVYAYNWATVVGGIWIAFTMAVVTVWLVCAWLSTGET